MRRALDALNTVVAAAIVAYAVWAWPRLPERIPAHFGADGQPDRWTDTSLVSWFLLPAIGLVTWGLLVGLRGWMVRRPHRINLPAGRTLDEFPPELRPAIIEHLRSFMALVAFEVLVIFGLIVVGNYRAAMGGDGQTVMLAVLAIAVLSGPVLLVVFFLGFQRITRSGVP